MGRPSSWHSPHCRQAAGFAVGLGLPHAALRNEIHGPRSGGLRGPTPATTDQTSQVESHQAWIPGHPRFGLRGQISAEKPPRDGQDEHIWVKAASLGKFATNAESCSVRFGSRGTANRKCTALVNVGVMLIGLRPSGQDARTNTKPIANSEPQRRDSSRSIDHILVRNNCTYSISNKELADAKIVPLALGYSMTWRTAQFAQNRHIRFAGLVLFRQ